MDEPAYMQEVMKFYTRYALARLRAVVAAKPDEVMLGGSASSLSASSPEFFRKYDLPFIKEAAKICKAAGVYSHLHVCGRSRKLVDIVVEETQLEFSGKRGHAVVVECGKPWRFVFWDKAQYIGCVQVSEDVWFTPEWCETNSPNDYHCYEPIMDKQLRYSRVELLEAGPARARVKWTYALCDMRYRIFHGDTWAQEIYTVYPDGVAVREIVLWPGTQSNHGGNANLWQVAEWILINAAGSKPGG